MHQPISTSCAIIGLFKKADKSAVYVSVNTSLTNGILIFLLSIFPFVT